MSALFRAEVLAIAPRRAQIRLTVVSAEVQRLWTTKSFALSLLLEPIFFGQAEPSEELLAIVPRAAIDGLDMATWKRAAPRVVTACTVAVDRPFADHLAELAKLDGDGLAEYFARGRAPVATVSIGSKPGVATHLTRGLTWDSAACDIL